LEDVEKMLTLELLGFILNCSVSEAVISVPFDAGRASLVIINDFHRPTLDGYGAIRAEQSSTAYALAYFSRQSHLKSGAISSYL